MNIARISRASLRNGAFMKSSIPMAARSMSTAPVTPSTPDIPVTPITPIDTPLPSPPVDPVVDIPIEAVLAETEAPNFVIGGIMDSIVALHQYLDIPLFAAIAAATLAVRVALLPISINTVRNGARMAIMKPELNRLTEAMKKDPNGDQMANKLQHQKQLQALFKKYDVNPFRSMIWPLFQLPVFMGFYFSLMKLGIYYPVEASTGGALWFPNLSLSDPMYILPVVNSLSFILLTELTMDVNMENKSTMKNVMRGVGVLMLPLTMNLPAAVFNYWIVSNTFTIAQTGLLKNSAIKKMFNIPDMPKEENLPPLKIHNPISKILNVS